tara:strand:+ start:26 stop:595 length:570 start_codon:yes stop_codon:yes gene_type:complete
MSSQSSSILPNPDNWPPGSPAFNTVINALADAYVEKILNLKTPIIMTRNYGNPDDDNDHGSSAASSGSATPGSPVQTTGIPSSLPEKNKELKVLRKRIAEQQILHEQQLRRIRNQIQIEREERERKEREKREEIKAEKERVTRKSHVASRIAAKAGRHAAYNAGVIANEARLAAEKAHRAVRKTKEANE